MSERCVVRLEDGRIIDDSSWPVKKLVDGKWFESTESVLVGALYDSTLLSEAEIAKLEKSPKS